MDLARHKAALQEVVGLAMSGTANTGNFQTEEKKSVLQPISFTLQAQYRHKNAAAACPIAQADLVNLTEAATAQQASEEIALGQAVRKDAIPDMYGKCLGQGVLGAVLGAGTA